MEVEVMRCESCGAPVDRMKERCEYCGSYYVEEVLTIFPEYDSYSASFSPMCETSSFIGFCERKSNRIRRDRAWV